MIKLRATVALEDGTVFPEVRLMPGDIVRFERHFGVRVGSLAGAKVTTTNADGEAETETIPPPFEHLLFLGWAPLHRKALTDLDFDAFCDVVENVDISTGGEASPTLPAPSEDDSSS